LKISEADFPPNILRSIGAGGGIPSKVSYRCNARVSRSESRVIAAAITLPPRQTPHSTISPDIFDRATYRTAWQSADIRSLLVIVKGRTFAMISATHGSTSVKPSDADVGSFRILRNSTPATLSTRFTKPAVVDLMERISRSLERRREEIGAGMLSDILRIPGRREARIVPLGVLGNGKRAQCGARSGRNRQLTGPGR
jgi:hypothetical protein